MKSYKVPKIRLSYVADITTDTKMVNSSCVSAELLRSSYEEGEMDYREFFKVLYLNRALKPLGIQTISMGGTTATIVDPKMIFSGALLANAQSIILCHNHPSGSLAPSAPDDALTRKLVEAGNLLDIKVTDHIILSSTGYYSYNDNCRL